MVSNEKAIFCCLLKNTNKISIFFRNVIRLLIITNGGSLSEVTIFGVHMAPNTAGVNILRNKLGGNILGSESDSLGHFNLLVISQATNCNSWKYIWVQLFFG